MLRLGLVVSVVALPLIGMEVINARQQEPLKVFQSAEDAVLACRIWQEAEGTFSFTSGGQRVQSALRSCEADLDHPVILGRRFSVVADAHYNRPLDSLHRSIAQRFPYLNDPQHTGAD